MKAMNAQVRLAEDSAPSVDLDKKQEAYCMGIAWALNVDKAMHPFQDVSGALGHGYYYACHKILEHSVGNAWWAKGSSWHFTKGMTGKAWSSDLTATMTRASALVSYACKCVPLGASLQSWCRTKESYVGKELRKDLQLRGSHVILAEEATYLEATYAPAIDAYKHVFDQYDTPTPDMLQGLMKRFQKTGKDLGTLTTEIDRVTSHRMAALYPKNKKAKKGKQESIETRITALDAEDYFLCFEPSIWANKAPMRPSYNPDDKSEVDWKATAAQYKAVIASVGSANVMLAALCQGFADRWLQPLATS